MEIKLRPFAVPVVAYLELPEGTVLRADKGWINLEDVPAPELAALCEQFRKDVFKAAGKEDPEITGNCQRCKGLGSLWLGHNKGNPISLEWLCPDCDGTGRAK